MSPDELHARFRTEIDRRGGDDRYIDGVEERELLQIALAHGFPADQARRALSDTCKERGYVIEAAVVQLVRDRLSSAGRIDRGTFDRVVSDARTAVAGTTRTDRQVQVLVVTTMEDAGLNRVRTGWFGNWYKRLKRDLGVG